VASGLSLSAMAKQLSHSPSTISRELGRNGGIDAYRATRAQLNAKKRATRRNVNFSLVFVNITQLVVVILMVF
jgi:IS30 family transposase